MSQLTFIISSLRAGGAERVLSILTSEFIDDGHSVTIISIAGDEPFYTFRPEIEILLLGENAPSNGAWHAMKLNWQRLKALRSAVVSTRPDILISFMDRVNVLTLLAAFGLRIPVIVSERTVPGVRHIGRSWEWLRKITYFFADRVVVQSEDAARFFSRKWPTSFLPVQIIPNPVLPIVATTVFQSQQPYLVSVGRFSEEKRFDFMMRAFAEAFPSPTDNDSLDEVLEPTLPDLVLVGDGPLRERLGRLAYELQLGERVRFTGRTTSPEEYIAGAEFYLCASRVEGFPMAVCESLALGVPVVATHCPGAIREIVINQENGFCVSDEDYMQTIRDFYFRNDRAAFSDKAKPIVEKFSIKRVKEMWNKEIRSLVQKTTN